MRQNGRMNPNESSTQSEKNKSGHMYLFYEDHEACLSHFPFLSTEIFISYRLSRNDIITFSIWQMKIIHGILSKFISNWSVFMSMEEKSPDFNDRMAIIWLKSELAPSRYIFFFFVISKLSIRMRPKLHHSLERVSINQCIYTILYQTESCWLRRVHVNSQGLFLS